MFKIHLKTTFRNLGRNRTNTAINLLSLIIGITVSVVIFTIIKYQYTFDHFHTNADRVYRVNFIQELAWGKDYGSQTPEPLHKVLRSDYPQIEAVSRTVGPMEVSLFIGEDKYIQNEILFADEHYFKMFDQEWIRGNKSDAFSDPKAVILTESLAEKFFGQEDPIGKTIDFQRRDLGIVKGIVKDPRKNTNLPYQMIAHVAMMKQIEDFYVRDNWFAMSIGTTWVMLPENVNPEALAVQFNDIVKDNLGEEAAESLSFELGNVKDIHTDDRYGNGVNYSIPGDTIYGLTVIALIVLITCAINFVNLSTAQALKKSQEVGIKKVLGSTKKQLATQFFLELGLLTFVAAFFSLWIAEVLLNEVNQVLSVISIDLKVELWSIAFALGLIVIITILAGLYPAGLLMNFKPLEVMRSKFTQVKGSKAMVRNGLLVTQFVFAQILIIIVLVFNAQFNYIQQKDLGYSVDDIVMFRDFMKTRYQVNETELNTVKTLLEESPYIEEVTYGTGGPNANFAWNTGVRNIGESSDQEIDCDYKHVDIDYKEMFNLDVIAGEWFTPSNYKDTIQRVVITDLLSKKLGYEDPIEAVSQRLVVNDRRAIIVGVLADFHTSNLKDDIKPSVFEGDFEGYNQGFMKIKDGFYSEAYDHYVNVATNYNEDYTPYTESYTDQLAADYELDRVIFKFINFTALLALLIGSLGLYSLISFIVQQKTKELGIRKVIGANTGSLLGLLSSKYIWFILLATALAAPLGYLGGNLYLESFAFRTSIGLSIFLTAFILTTVIALASISYRAFKAVTINPVKSLRYE